MATREGSADEVGGGASEARTTHGGLELPPFPLGAHPTDAPPPLPNLPTRCTPRQPNPVANRAVRGTAAARRTAKTRSPTSPLTSSPATAAAYGRAARSRSHKVASRNPHRSTRLPRRHPHHQEGRRQVQSSSTAEMGPGGLARIDRRRLVMPSPDRPRPPPIARRVGTRSSVVPEPRVTASTTPRTQPPSPGEPRRWTRMRATRSGGDTVSEPPAPQEIRPAGEGQSGFPRRSPRSGDLKSGCATTLVTSAADSRGWARAAVLRAKHT